MSTSPSIDVLVLGTGPGALAIAAALVKENLRVEVLSACSHTQPWPFTYGIWGEEVDELGLEHLLEYRWKNTVSFFGAGTEEFKPDENEPTKHERDYGLFDKEKLQQHWIKQCDDAAVKWHKGHAIHLDVSDAVSTITTSEGKKINTRLLVDATGYEPVFLKTKQSWPIAIQTCYGVVGKFNKPPVDKALNLVLDDDRP